MGSPWVALGSPWVAHELPVGISQTTLWVTIRRYIWIAIVVTHGYFMWVAHESLMGDSSGVHGSPMGNLWVVYG